VSPLRVATYCRISDDRVGQGLGVQRQAEDCGGLLEAKGWTSAGTFVDNDCSAYSGKIRPQYGALLDAVRAGTVDGIVAWHPDRLHRSPKELEEFIDLVERHRVTVSTVRAGEWDLSTPAGRGTARILGAVARMESEHKSDRVTRALEQRAALGASHGRIAYGYRRHHLPDGSKVEVLDEEQADVVRGIAARILAGHSLRQITADLNAAGTPSPSGKPWAKVMVRHLVTRERNIGLRVHRREVIGTGDWPPLMERTVWEQVRAVLADPARKTSTSSTAVHLLSGLARCGVCDAPMRASMNRQTPAYRCSAKSCVARNRADVDTYVVAVVLERLRRPDLLPLLTPQDDRTRKAAAEAAELRAKLDNAADDYADGVIDREQMHRLSERLRPRLEAAQAAARQVNDAPLLDGLVGVPDPGRVWDGLPLARRRAVIDLLLTIRVLRARQGARSFDPGSLEVSWKSSGT
jgi:site-specific DNA recombinase